MRAREEYFDRAGKVFDDDAELFEGRMASFLEWYVLERPLAGIGLTPVACALEEGAARPADERRTLAALATSHHSVFELFETSGRDAGRRGPDRGRALRGAGAAQTAGEWRPAICSRRAWSGTARRSCSGKTFLFHPPDAREVVLEWIARAVATGVAHEEILFHLSRQHIRWHRHGHVGAAKVYRDA